MVVVVVVVVVLHPQGYIPQRSQLCLNKRSGIKKKGTAACVCLLNRLMLQEHPPARVVAPLSLMRVETVEWGE